MTDLVKYVGESSFELPNPSILILWKVTDVCMDFWCECGEHHHVNAEFVYSIKCGGCGAVYAMPSAVVLKRIEPGQVFYNEAHVCEVERHSLTRPKQRM